jgi:uncharacterized protein
MPAARIESLTIYPIKSCRGLSLDSAVIRDEGLQHDRHWMIVDAHGTFLTQREAPNMARIVPSLSDYDSAQPELSVQLADVRGQVHQDSPQLTLPYLATNPQREVTVWNHQGQAHDCGDQAASFLSAFLGRPARLVRFNPQHARQCSTTWTGELKGKTQFADGYPILVIGQESVADLGKRLGDPALNVMRFRPNIVLSGLSAYDEDVVQRLDLTVPAPLSLRLVKPCPRCTIPQVDPMTGAPCSNDPTAELATYRYHPLAEGAVLGMNALPVQGQGQSLTVGQIFDAVFNF